MGLSITCNPVWGPAHGITYGGRSADQRVRVLLQERIPTAGLGCLTVAGHGA